MDAVCNLRFLMNSYEQRSFIPTKTFVRSYEIPFVSQTSLSCLNVFIFQFHVNLFTFCITEDLLIQSKIM